jgi:hypothetical protein
VSGELRFVGANQAAAVDLALLVGHHLVQEEERGPLGNELDR